MHSIQNKIEHHELISFDIFDTLLIRPYINPYHLFLHMETYYNEKGFSKVRIDAEINARQNSKKEDINFNDIWNLIPYKYQYLKEKELLFEETLLKPNPNIKNIYDIAVKNGKKIVFISDMYLPQRFIEKILLKNGYKNFENVYLSGQIGYTKNTGNLFKYFLCDYNITPSKVLHIGDSQHSDIKMAKQFGIEAIHIPKISEQLFRYDKRFKKLYLENENDLAISTILALIAEKFIASKKFLKNSKHFWKDWGYIIGGPIAYGFAQYILNKCKNIEVDNILFIARDGYSIKKAVDILKTKDIKTFYVYAQRILRAKILLDYGDDHNAELLYDILPDRFKSEKTFTSIQEKKIIIENTLPYLREKAITKKLEYLKYLEALGIEKNKKIVVVDTGAATFSAQQLVHYTLNTEVDGIYTTVSNEKYAKTKNIIYHTWKNKFDNIDDITGLIEFLFTSPEPPIIDIKENQPVYIAPVDSKELLRNKLYPDISSGEISFVADIKQRLQNLNIEFCCNSVNKFVRIFCTNMSNFEANRLSKIYCSSNANHTRYDLKLLEQIKSFSKIKNKKLNTLISINREYTNGITRIKITLFGFIRIKIKI